MQNLQNDPVISNPTLLAFIRAANEPSVERKDDGFVIVPSDEPPFVSKAPIATQFKPGVEVESTRGNTAAMKQNVERAFSVNANTATNLQRFYESNPKVSALVVDDLKGTLRSLRSQGFPIPNSALQDSMLDAFTLTLGRKDPSTGKITFQHVMVVRSDVASDPARAAVVTNHEMNHMSFNQFDRITSVLSERGMEAEIYRRSIAGLTALAADIRNGPNASLAPGILGRMAEERRRMVSFQ